MDWWEGLWLNEGFATWMSWYSCNVFYPEWKVWEGWLATIREKLSTIPTVRTEILQPDGPSNYAPQLRVSWDTAKLGITGTELAEALLRRALRNRARGRRGG